jgi:hypothetical protein
MMIAIRPARTPRVTIAPITPATPRLIPPEDEDDEEEFALASEPVLQIPVVFPQEWHHCS